MSRRKPLAVLALVLPLLAARPAGALFNLSSVAHGAFLGGVCAPGRHEVFFTPRSSPDGLSVTSGSVGEFTCGGALCTSSGPANYLCARALAVAEFAGAAGGGGPISLRALARLTRRNATEFGGFSTAYSSAQVEIYGLAHAVLPTPAAIAYIHFGLSGTVTQSASDSGVVVVASGVARLTAGKTYALQCLGQSCPPIRVPIANPAAPDPESWDMQYLGLYLEARTAISAPSGIVFDAEAVADLSDTLTLDAIALHDANDQPIPGAQVYVTDLDGNPIHTFPAEPPPPTTTTVPEATTTTTTVPGVTTTTTLPVGVTTTTTPAGVTTTTTVPGGCAAAATVGSVACRLAELAGAVSASDGVLEAKLLRQLGKARSALDGAGGAGRQAKKALRKVRAAVSAYGKILGSRKARRTLPDASRAVLLGPVAGLRADLTALLRATATAP